MVSQPQLGSLSSNNCYSIWNQLCCWVQTFWLCFHACWLSVEITWYFTSLPFSFQSPSAAGVSIPLDIFCQEELKIGDPDTMPLWEYDTLIWPHNHKISCKVIKMFDELITCWSKKSCDKSWINRLFWAHSQFQQFPMDYPPKKLH